MKKFSLHLFYFLLIHSIAVTAMQPATFLAVVKHPVIDLNNSFPARKTLPASPEIKGCPRAHQALFNELTECQKCQDDNIQITFSEIIYGYDEQTKTVRNTFWAYSSDLVPLSKLPDAMVNSIPPALYAYSPTIVLTYPWNYYSVGTRFVHVCEQDTPTSFAILHPNFESNTTYLDFVPRTDALEEALKTPAQARTLFVTLINDLVARVHKANSGIIPYVWGGSSFVQTYQDAFYQQDGVWQRIGKNDPYSGYDCSEFIMRMAKIAGISFPWKTSTAIERGLKKLSSDCPLENGDIIWVPGHVMIVSDIEKNELIEARSYSVGYGCVHRMSLQDCFENIQSYAHLLENYYQNIPVKFKNKQGIPLEKVYSLKFLKLI